MLDVMPPTSKELAYAELVTERKSCSACAELTNPSQACGGRYDSERIGPYSRWQGNIDAQVVVVAQDFADMDTFVDVQGWPGERVQTNLVLVEHAAMSGLSISPPKQHQSDDTLFFSNAVLCLKQGNIQSRIPTRCFRECGRRFLRRTIELVSPRAVITLGTKALDATLKCFDLSRTRGLVELIESECTFDLPCASTLFPMCHPSRTVLNTVRSLDEQKSDWARLGRWLTAA